MPSSFIPFTYGQLGSHDLQDIEDILLAKLAEAVAFDAAVGEQRTDVAGKIYCPGYGWAAREDWDQ